MRLSDGGARLSGGGAWLSARGARLSAQGLGYLSEYFRFCWFNLVICHTINSDLSVLPAAPNGSACTPLGPILVLVLMFHLLILQPYKRVTNQNAEPGWDTRWKADPGLPATRSILQGPEIHLLR
jgi:hypothetical protein